MEGKIRLAVFGQKRLSREGGIEIVVKELCTRMAQNGCDITCYNRAGHHVSGAEYDKTIEYDGIRQKVVPTITVIMYGRMIEIYLYTSLAPIPFATMSNREWGHVGTNYFRGLFALAFQAFLMMVCVAIYAALIGSIRVSSDIHSALFGTMAYTVILCFSLLKTGSLSKQIFGSH